MSDKSEASKSDEMHVHPRTGLVPCEILISNGGHGLRKGEIRGLDRDVAIRMRDKKTARPLTKKEIAKLTEEKAISTDPETTGRADWDAANPNAGGGQGTNPPA